MFRVTKGFTLIEVIVSVFVIAVAITGLAMGFSYGLAMVGELQGISVADRVVQEKMEELRGTPSLEEASGSEGREGIMCRYAVNISPVPAATGLSEVTVSVSFDSHAGRTISRSLVTYFTENGITKAK